MTEQGFLFDGASVEKGARFSESRVHRYALWRIWEKDTPKVMFVGLNPSTADETKDDPTIRRCIAFAKAWGYGGLYMLNIFAFRATEPADMKDAADPIGPDNDEALEEYARRSEEIIAAWGVHGTWRDRNRFVTAMVLANFEIKCLRKTKGGHPQHPLYLPQTTKPIIYRKKI